MVTPTPPPPPLPLPPHCTTFFLTFLLLISAPTLTCLSSSSKPSSSPCPPFPAINTPFAFPFTSLQITCSSPHSLVSINNLSFLVLRYTSTSLRITPHNNTLSQKFPSIPPHPFNFSNSPFRISDDLCPRLLNLHSCSNPTINCSDFQCQLIKTPGVLLPGCGSDSNTPQMPNQGCQQDVLGYLDKLLNLGFLIQWHHTREANFSKEFKEFSQFKNSRLSRRVVVISSVFAMISVVMVVVLVIFRLKNLRSFAGEEDPTIVFLHKHRSANLLPPLFTYEELRSSTNRFDPRRKLGDGGFGSVYLGKLRDGRLVAVKHLHRNHARRAFTTRSFCNEILILSSIDHPNLVRLHGYCSDPKGLLLVYDFVPNGTLSDHLHGPRKSSLGKASLTWQVRVEIALQTAMAIEYLHFSVEPPVVHRDITSSNIFMEKDMKVKVGDFGLSRLLIFPEETSSSSTHCVWTGPQGTPGYLDPDYHRSFRLTEKSDVYSFGVVLLELISGRKAIDQRREMREATLADLVVPMIQMGLLRQVVDPDLLNGFEYGVAAMAELAFRCVAAEKDDRPDAKEIVAALRNIRGRVAAATAL